MNSTKIETLESLVLMSASAADVDLSGLTISTPDGDLIVATNADGDVNSGDGNDFLIGAAGANALSGGEGDDLLMAIRGDNLIDGGNGIDTAVLPGLRADYEVRDLDFGGFAEVTGNGRADLLISVENLAFDDEVVSVADAMANGPTGSGIGLNGWGAAADLTDASANESSSENDVLMALKAGETLDGEAGDDVMIGAAGDNQLNGGAGHDTFITNRGDNSIDGGTGIDRVVYSGNLADFTITSLENGRVQVQGTEVKDVVANVEVLMFRDGVLEIESTPETPSEPQPEPQPQPEPEPELESQPNPGPESQSEVVEEAVPESQSDSAVPATDTTLTVTSSNDWIAGTDSDDVIDAGDGDDAINAQIGNNDIDGGDGIDTLISYGVDSSEATITRYDSGLVVVEMPGLNGGVNTNRLTNVERLEFNDGIIELQTLPVIIGSGSSDWIAGTDADDVIDAGNGDDAINAQIGNNTINGGDGIDTLISYGVDSSEATITRYDSGLVVVEMPGLNGGVNTNRLTSVERLEFNDGIIDVSTLPVTADAAPVAAVAGDSSELQDDAQPENTFESQDPPEALTETDSGLRYRIEREGSDRFAGLDDVVEVHYEGRLKDGTVFDSSYDRGETISFALRQVIEGWQEGMQLVGVGGKIELEIPAELAYGASGRGGIPPNATLYFTVELIDVLSAAT